MTRSAPDDARAAPQPLSYYLAQAVSWMISPLLLPPLLFALVLLHFEATAYEVGWTLAVAVTFFVGVPLGYLLHLVRRRRVASIELPDRLQRTVPFLIGAASYGAAAVVMAVTGRTATALVVALAACHVANTLLTLLVTLRWKISVHVLATAGFVSMLLFVAQTAWPTLAHRPAETLLLQPLPLTSLLALVPLLMWARVRTGAHTVGQVWAGAGVGLVVPYLELWALWRIGAV